MPPGFGPHGGEIWVADEDGNAVHAIKIPPWHRYSKSPLSRYRGRRLRYPAALRAPSARRRLLPGEQQLFQIVWQYPLSDFLGLGGNVILASEAGGDGADTSLVTFRWD